MKKLKATITSLATLTALSLVGAAVICAQKSAPITVKADAPNVQLISPQSYQQYLPLTTPTAVSVTSGFTAIADGKTIYIYEGDVNPSQDSETGAYRTYTHANAINQLAFDEENNLYFLSEFELYKLSAADLQNPTAATKMNIVCSNFAIQGNALYYYAMSKTVIKKYSLTEGTYADITLSTPLQDNSPLTTGLEGLYYVSKMDNAYTVHAVNTDTGSSNAIATFTQPLKSMTIASHLFCAVMEDGSFYAYNYNDLRSHKNAEAVTPITNTANVETDQNGYLAVYTHGNEVYAIRGNAIRHYSISMAAFTDFEITSASASPHRLNGANDVFLAENKLFIADDGNDRISVYNTESGKFETAINTALPAPMITSYKDTLLAASTEEAVLYSLSAAHYGVPLLTVSNEEIDGEIIGVACVYDKYYLLTDDNYTYTFTANSGVWSYTEQEKIPLNGMKAKAFTADVYGSLYVAYDSGEMYRFTEKELLSTSATGLRVADNLTNTKKIAVDYDENLYALSEGTLTKYIQNAQGMYEVNAIYTPNYGLVKDDNPVLTSFTFGVKNQDAYFLYENDYVVKSDELQIPQVNPIPVVNAVDCIFGAGNRDYSMVTIDEDAILTEFDITALQNATEFPYIAFERRYTPFTALKIGEEEGHAIIAVENGNVGYKTYLVETQHCTTLNADTYRTAYTETDKTGYLTNAVRLYKFPYLNNLLTVAEMPRGAQVTLLGELRLPDRTYYEITYTDTNGVVQTGYVPTSYVNLFDGTAPTSQTITYGATEDDTDSVGRMVYILLGFGAIGILIDVLLLKKSKETDDN